MAVLRSQCIFPFFTNIPGDVITNQMHWITDDTNDPAVDSATIRGRLDTFYAAVYSGVAASYVDWANASIKTYDLSDAPPRTPVYEFLLFSTAPTAFNAKLPTEVATVLSFRGDYVSGQNAARRRNRIYIGGFSESVLTAGTTSAFPELSSAFRSTLGVAASALLAANNGVVDWCGYSTAGTLPVTFTIQKGWIDNSPDTQRRRSVKASARSTWQ